MNEAIGEILSPAIVVAISPVPVIAIVLMLATPRARGNGLAFLLGWLLGLAVVGTVVLLAAGGLDATEGDEPATWVSVLLLVLGALLIGLAMKQWRGRPKGGTGELPHWMRAVDAFKPPKAFGIAALLSGVNPKNLLLTVAAAAAIAQTGISAGEQAIALAVFIVIATLGVIVPLGIHFALGERSRPLLDGLKSWMAANNVAIMAVITLVIGTKLLGDGLAGL
jgi:threonine/homoserine/homoserine lactone efflux protein